MKRRLKVGPPRRGAAVLLSGCLLASRVGAAPANAEAAQPTSDEAQAAADFAAGERAFDAGDYRGAAEAFEAAYRSRPHHAPLWNAARSWQRAGEEVRAANLLDRYLSEAPADAPDRNHASEALAELRERLARVQVQRAGVTDVSIDDVPFEGTTRYVAPGEHVAAARARGQRVTRLVVVGAGELVSLTLAPPEEPPRAYPPVNEGSSRHMSPVVAIVAGAVTVLGVALTTASGIDTVHKRDAFLDDRTQRRLDDAYASQTRTNVALGVTAGAAIFTGVMAALFVDWKGAR